jgi:hypothetical protein
MWWWYLTISDTNKSQDCTHAHDRVARASAAVDRERDRLKESNREARHGTRNIKMLMDSVLHRLERRNGR